MASPLNAATADRVLASGAMPQIAAAIRQEIRERQAIVAEVLPRSAFVTRQGASYFGLKMEGNWTAEAFTRAAASIGIGVTPYDVFKTTPLMRGAMVRICHNAAPDLSSLRHALVGLAELRAVSPSGRPAERALAHEAGTNDRN